MYRKVLAVAVLVWLAAGDSLAGPRDEVAMETDAAAIVRQQTEIRKEAQDRRGRYRDMPGQDRERLLQLQERVIGKLDGRARTTELGSDEQLALFNDLEEISALVNKAEDSRMVCERSRPIGSNRPVRVCKTVAERRAERERALDARGGRDARCAGGACPESGMADWR